MFGFAGHIILASLMVELAEREAFEKSLEGLPPDMVAMLREKRAEMMRERKRDRQHAELVQAIRDSRPSGLGLFW